MRIDLKIGTAPAGDADRPEQTASQGRGSAIRQAGSGEDTAEISQQQVRLSTLVAEVNRVPEIRQEKVAALGLAIRQGRYDVSPEQTAEAMIADYRVRPAA